MVAKSIPKLLLLSLPLAIVFVFLSLTPSTERALQSPPKNEDAFAKGVKAYNDGNYRLSERLFSSYLESNPNSMIRDIGLLWYGKSLIALHRFTEAEKVADSLEREFPKTPLIQKLRGELKSARTAKTIQRHSTTSSKTQEKVETSKAGAPTPAAKKVASPKTANPRIQRTSPIKSAATAASRPVSVAKEHKPMPPGGQAFAERNSKRPMAAGKSATQSLGLPLGKKKEVQGVPPARARKAPVLHPPLERKAKVELKRKIEPGKAAAVPTAAFGFRNRRDPFRPLVARSTEEPPANLPPGKKGLLITRLQLKGIVKSEKGNIAIVQSAPNSVAIFLREKDSLYDGEVERIYEDRVVFKRLTTDKLGHVHPEEVVRRLQGGGNL